MLVQSKTNASPPNIQTLVATGNRAELFIDSSIANEKSHEQQIPEHLGEFERLKLINLINKYKQDCDKNKSESFALKNVDLPNLSSDCKTFQTISIPPDGNDFYGSLSFLLFGTNEHQKWIRDSLFSYMTTLKLKPYLDKISIRINLTPIASYLNKRGVKNSGVSAQNVEIQCAAEMFEVPIVLFSSDINEMPVIFRPDAMRVRPTNRGFILQHDNGYFSPVIKYDKTLDHTSSIPYEPIYNAKPFSLKTQISSSSSYTETPFSSTSGFYTETENATETDTCTETDAETEKAIEMIQELNRNYDTETTHTFENNLFNPSDSNVTQTFDNVGFSQESSASETYDNKRINPTTVKTSSPSKTITKPPETPVMKKVGETANYHTFLSKQTDNESSYKVFVSNDYTKSVEENRKCVIEKLFKTAGARKQDPLPQQIANEENVLKLNKLMPIISLLNQQPELGDKNKVYQHVKDLMFFSSLKDLLSLHINHVKLDEFKAKMIDIRAKLVPLRTQYEGASSQGQMQFACLAFPKSSESDSVAYYHEGNGKKTWMQIPFNPNLSPFIDFLKPGQTTIIGQTAYILSDTGIIMINLFDASKPRTISMSDTDTTGKFKLVKSNTGQVYVLYEKHMKVRLVNPESVQPWFRLKELGKYRHKQSTQLTMSTNDNSEIVVLPHISNDKHTVLADLYGEGKMDFRKMVQTYEFIILRKQSKKKCLVTASTLGYSQIKLGAYDQDPDTRYLLIDANELTHFIEKLKISV